MDSLEVLFMKVLLLFPPQWTPLSPHFAIPSLKGQLEHNGFSTKVFDLNIDFYNKILNKSFLIKSIDKSSKMFQGLLKDISKYHSPTKQFMDYPFPIQNKMLKYTKIKEYLTKKKYELENIPDLIHEAVSILKNEQDFYNPDLLIRALNIIDAGLDIASLPYTPTSITFDNYANPLFKLTYDNIKYYCFDKDTNIFMEYYDEIVDELLEEDVDYIGISINSSTQIVGGLTLSHLLKKKTKAHVNIGGNFFGRVIDNLAKEKEFFELFADSVLVEEGERPVVELAKAIAGEIPFDAVPNLVFYRDGAPVITKKDIPMKLDDMSNISLDGYDLSKYFCADIVMPVQSSRGCYWRKCSFCDQDFGQNFNVKHIEKFVSELSEIKEKYGIKHFEFIDESVGPSYMEGLADELLKNGVDVKYFCNARLERAFSKEILEKAYKSGLSMILWGFESGSNKVMELINKGIDIDKRLEILKDSTDAGIWNFAFIFFGFPAETVEDAEKTIKIICDNVDVIHSYGRSVFTMGKHTKLREDPGKYGIISIKEQQQEFAPFYDFDSVGMSKKELHDVIAKCTLECNKAYDKPLWMYLRFRELLFLYVARYGVDWVRKFKFNA